MSTKTQWQAVCKVEDLIADSGIAVWTPAGPVAIFYLPQQIPALFAVGHFDPFSNANVIARGITGDLGGEPVVASPIYKQHFSLRTGVCLEDDSVRIPSYSVLLDGDSVLLEVPVENRSEAVA
ncbi:nitrite reductase small subunit NirD [Marinobacter sp. SS21]|uniref:nitrite reductase small subunit NirD n=1 Tax=Marinobacter sp. SS21 TaxID=2979460 RepID=UPI002331056E|nr:nitrite reductase small subunit NirD [Marinobacter sp. SS21]MDC0661117.1 nitrite reductase small subunit NirD [Marinobacter sp. SS21]